MRLEGIFELPYIFSSFMKDWGIVLSNRVGKLKMVSSKVPSTSPFLSTNIMRQTQVLRLPCLLWLRLDVVVSRPTHIHI